jgi:hypothetical protein
LAVAAEPGDTWTIYEVCGNTSDTCFAVFNRFVEVLTSNNSVQTNVTLQSSSLALYYAAVSLDINGDLIFGLTIFSSTLNPTATVAGVPGGVFGAVVGGIGYQVARRPIRRRAAGRLLGCRERPNDPTVVWVLQE